MKELTWSVKDKEGQHLGWMIFCPACKNGHLFDNRWTFNNDMERPTFRASMLVQTGHYINGHNGNCCWCTYNAEHPNDPSPFTCYICHSFVTDGKIQFLPDSTHALSGQTVDLEEE